MQGRIFFFTKSKGPNQNPPPPCPSPFQPSSLCPINPLVKENQGELEVNPATTVGVTIGNGSIPGQLQLDYFAGVLTCGSFSRCLSWLVVSVPPSFTSPKHFINVDFNFLTYFPDSRAWILGPVLPGLVMMTLMML